MSLGEVDDVDVVAQAGAVGGVVVVAEHADLLELADGDARDERHEVVRDAGGIFADEAARVRAHRVEVAEHRHVQLGVDPRDVGEHDLVDALGLASTRWTGRCSSSTPP